MASLARTSILLLSWFPSIAVTSSQKPNVLFVVIDDLGFTDVGFRSHEIRTPTVDNLAKHGVVLDQYYVQDVCSPSRATFMTGRFAMHHTVVDWIPSASTYGLPLNETTMADKFKEVGYATHAVGKWHLGFYRKEMTTTFRGFESFYGFYGGGEDYFKHTSGGHYDFRRDPTPNCGPGCSQVLAEADGRYSTTLFSEEAVRIIKAHPIEKPLFLYLAYQAVHAPAEVPQEYMDAYNTTIADPMRRKFAGMLSCMDEGLANVTETLQARGMMDNTLVVFTTDNGGPINTGDGIGARNWPLRGAKHSIWEGGTRGTALISGKMLKQKGYTFTHLMHGADWMPTMGALAGFDVSTIPLPLDGVSQWDAINAGNDYKPQRTSFVYGNSTNDCKWTTALSDFQQSAQRQVPCGFGIRDQQWKLILGYGGGPDTWCNKSSHGLICKEWPGLDVIPNMCKNQKAGVCLPSNDIRSFPAASSADCCDACANTSGCVAWTHNGHGGHEKTPTCYLKAKAHRATDSKDCTSGTMGDTPFPPSPSPSPTPPPAHACLETGFCLWDVVADPYEHTEISQKYPQVVTALKAKMADILQSYHAYQLDPHCGKPVFEPNKKVGAAWAPWCYNDGQQIVV